MGRAWERADHHSIHAETAAWDGWSDRFGSNTRWVRQRQTAYGGLFHLLRRWRCLQGLILWPSPELSFIIIIFCSFLMYVNVNVGDKWDINWPMFVSTDNWHFIWIQRAIENGAVAVNEPEEKEWGQKVGYVRDIDGIVVRLGSYVNPPKKAWWLNYIHMKFNLLERF